MSSNIYQMPLRTSTLSIVLATLLFAASGFGQQQTTPSVLPESDPLNHNAGVAGTKTNVDETPPARKISTDWSPAQYLSANRKKIVIDSTATNTTVADEKPASPKPPPASGDVAPSR